MLAMNKGAAPAGEGIYSHWALATVRPPDGPLHYLPTARSVHRIFSFDCMCIRSRLSETRLFSTPLRVAETTGRKLGQETSQSQGLGSTENGCIALPFAAMSFLAPIVGTGEVAALQDVPLSTHPIDRAHHEETRNTSHVASPLVGRYGIFYHIASGWDIHEPAIH
ncbi:hypothetical protein DAEQUDRAFT_303200 [Daedalea quercina L-15889]|uniref:Uncharacterized protein n=1 Tax=Daedalea quercina L-15889 TaxID=1314783 RepID=A0A165Q6A8_9APHY|nr:hypothetical protein DAEQUDRAFT_303200 [Daedalea quercina L-15889]